MICRHCNEKVALPHKLLLGQGNILLGSVAMLAGFVIAYGILVTVRYIHTLLL